LLYGRTASKKEIDLLVVGKPSQSKLADLVSEAEKIYDHELNYTILSEEEFEFRKKRQDPFIFSILTQPLVMLLGDEKEFLS